MAFQTEILDSAATKTIMNRRELELAAQAAADRVLKARGYIALDEVFREMGKLEAKDWEEWRRGRVPYLERVICLNLSRINAVCRAVHASARRGNLKPSWTAYVRWGKGSRPPLRFTKSGDPHLERAWATRYINPSTKPSAAKAPGKAVADKPDQVGGGCRRRLDSGADPVRPERGPAGDIVSEYRCCEFPAIDRPLGRWMSCAGDGGR